MTTIAANKEMVAADSRVTVSDSVYSTKKKIIRVGSLIAGAAGLEFYVQQFFEILKSGGEPKFEIRKQDEDNEELEFAGLVLCPERGVVFYDDALAPQVIECGFHAVGSGAQAARAAMIMGADPKQAVKVAAQVDSATGLPVVSLRLKGTSSGAKSKARAK